jgi:mono/diheme cytochrome c family protein
MSPKPTIALLVLATVAAAGCGGGSGAGTHTTGSASSGAKLFTSVGCSTCHTLKAAGAHGQVGPDLDQLKPTEAAVARQVTHGGGGMPAFAKTLDATQIRAVAHYVATVAGR